MNIWLKKEPAGNWSECHFQKMPWRLSKLWNRHVHDKPPVLAFSDYTKPFLLETDASKDGLGAVLLQKQADRQYHPVHLWQHSPYASWEELSLNQAQVFDALKWAVTEHFKEYLPYQSFLVKKDNNPLTYLMMTPNLDATSHQWGWCPCAVQLSNWNTRKDVITLWWMHTKPSY